MNTSKKLNQILNTWSKSIPLIIYGQEGSGKTTIALEILKGYNLVKVVPENIDNINTSMIISRNVHWSAPSKIPFNVASIVWNYNQWTDSLIHDIISYNYNNTSSVLLLEEEGEGIL